MLLKSFNFSCKDIKTSFRTLSRFQNIVPTLPFLMPTSILMSPSFHISHQRYMNFSTSWSVSSFVSTWLVSSVFILNICVFLVLTLSPTLPASYTIGLVIHLWSCKSSAMRQMSSASVRSLNLRPALHSIPIWQSRLFSFWIQTLCAINGEKVCMSLAHPHAVLRSIVRAFQDDNDFSWCAMQFHYSPHKSTMHAVEGTLKASKA